MPQKLVVAISRRVPRLTLVAAALSLAAVSSSSQSSAKDVRYLKYKNCGAYTVDGLNLTVRKKNKSNNKVTETTFKVGDSIPGHNPLKSGKPKNNGICIDLTNTAYGIANSDGKQDSNFDYEVWFDYNIILGENKSCKGKKVSVDVSTSNIQHYRSAGETFSGNGCTKG